MGTWRMNVTELAYQLFIVLLFCVQPGNALNCYECSDSFTAIWKPQNCQVNATAVPSRLCNNNQLFCYVASETVKGIFTHITRNCIDECFYGCVASEFGVTKITCTSCCEQDLCNTGNAAAHADANCLILFILTLFSVVPKVLLSRFVY